MSVQTPPRPRGPGWPRAFPVAQAPNAPLLIALAGRAAQAVTRGRTRRAGRAVFTIGLSVWAWGEASDGDNWLRRLLGAAALAWLVSNPAAGNRR